MKTYDIGLAAAFSMHGYSPTLTTTAGDRRIFFAFPDTPEVAQLRRDYYAGRMTGVLATYNGLARDLTAQVLMIRRAAQPDGGAR